MRRRRRAEAMFGAETFIVRIAEDAMAPRVREGDYVRVDPDEPATHGRFVAVREAAIGDTAPEHALGLELKARF